MREVKVKICGLTNLEDALAATDAGADALGFVFADSPRRMSVDRVRGIVRDLPTFIVTVGVFVDHDLDEMIKITDACGLDRVQVHGDRTDDAAAFFGRRAVKAVRVKPGLARDWAADPQAALLLDAWSPDQAGGTGRTFDWSQAVEPARIRPIILAGGLTPENVAAAVQQVNPYAVDVSSGVETSPGRKDHDRLQRFIDNAKNRACPAA
jgi:phosphoribosylanthranilate isomerase